MIPFKRVACVHSTNFLKRFLMLLKEVLKTATFDLTFCIYHACMCVPETVSSSFLVTEMMHVIVSFGRAVCEGREIIVLWLALPNAVGNKLCC